MDNKESKKGPPPPGDARDTWGRACRPLRQYRRPPSRNPGDKSQVETQWNPSARAIVARNGCAREVRDEGTGARRGHPPQEPPPHCPRGTTGSRPRLSIVALFPHGTDRRSPTTRSPLPSDLLRSLSYHRGTFSASLFSRLFPFPRHGGRNPTGAALPCHPPRYASHAPFCTTADRAPCAPRLPHPQICLISRTPPARPMVRRHHPHHDQHPRPYSSAL